MNRLGNQLKALWKSVIAGAVSVVLWPGRVALRGVRAADAAVNRAIHNLTQAIETAITDILRAIKHDCHRLVAAINRFVGGIRDGIKHFCGGIRDGIVGGLHAFARSVKGIGTGFVDLFRQIGGDLKHLAIYSCRQSAQLVLSGVRGLGKSALLITFPMRRLLRPVTEPLRRTFASKAKEEALGVTTTPDNRSHWELLTLAAFAIVVTAGVLAYAGLAHLPGGHFRLPQLSPHQIYTRMATYSPMHLTGLAALAMAVIFTLWFWMHMLRDSYLRRYTTQTEKTKWRIVTTLFFIPGALYYFFKVYNHWTLRQFVAYHLVSVMVTGVAILVTTSTGGALYYFNQRANAQVQTHDFYKVPNLTLDEKSKQALLSRNQYGAPLTPNAAGGRIDPFAPIAGQVSASNSPMPVSSGRPSPSSSPSASPSVPTSSAP